ncbi:MAG: hypothetical protein KDK41_07720 [Leptospiraceae bacterium]|nr:hypothetical protein [Leptospiraceae bacterium]
MKLMKGFLLWFAILIPVTIYGVENANVPAEASTVTSFPDEPENMPELTPGTSLRAGLSAGYQLPFGDIAGIIGGGISVSANADYALVFPFLANIPFVIRAGGYVGLQMHSGETRSFNASLLLIPVIAEVIAEYPIAMQGILLPFVATGGGVTYTSLTREYSALARSQISSLPASESESAMNGTFSFATGVRYLPQSFHKVQFKAEIRSQLIFEQSSFLFLNLSAGAEYLF